MPEAFGFNFTRFGTLISKMIDISIVFILLPEGKNYDFLSEALSAGNKKVIHTKTTE